MNLKSGVGQLQIIVSSFALASALMAGQAAADGISGRVLGGGAPIANSTVTLWAATAGAPVELGQAKTGADGQFSLNATAAPAMDASLYLVAQGGKAAADKSATDNPAIVLMTVLGSKAPPRVTINEFTTVASAWTHAQFLTGTAISGHALGLSIAAGNVPNFVDLESGGYGTAIQDAINSTQTPTLANFATLTNVMAGCITRVTANACASFFHAATGPGGKEPGIRWRQQSPSHATLPINQSGYLLFSTHSIRYRRVRGCAYTVHTLFELGAECVGAATQVYRWRSERTRQAHVRQQGQRLDGR